MIDVLTLTLILFALTFFFMLLYFLYVYRFTKRVQKVLPKYKLKCAKSGIGVFFYYERKLGSFKNLWYTLTYFFQPLRNREALLQEVLGVRIIRESAGRRFDSEISIIHVFFGVLNLLFIVLFALVVYQTAFALSELSP